MSAAQDIADGLSELETDFPSTFTWNGANYPCVAGPANVTKDLGLGGFMPVSDLIVNVVAGRFANGPPQLKQTCAYTGPEFPTGKQFRIDRIFSAPGNPFLQFHLIDPDKAI